tara:strand:+ start:6253 stop:6999 length:747 start_codon:yes stop_codon:yes gene_type:complete
MASIDINIGSSADDGTGDNLRAFATNVAAMFAEIYGLGTAESDLTTGTAFRPALSLIADQAANTVIVRDANSSGTLSAKAVTDQQILIGDGTGFTAAALSGDVTMANTGAVTIANTAVETAMIADDNVTHDKLEGRYTSRQTIATQSGTISINWGSHSVFKFTNSLNGTTTLDYTGYKVGQTIEICGLTGSQTINLTDQGTGTSYHYKVGGDYDGSSTNLLQVTCLHDDGTSPEFAYAVNTYADDTTP